MPARRVAPLWARPRHRAFWRHCGGAAKGGGLVAALQADECARGRCDQARGRGGHQGGPRAPRRDGHVGRAHPPRAAQAARPKGQVRRVAAHRPKVVPQSGEHRRRDAARRREYSGGDELRTDVDGVRKRILEVGAENVLCVLSTTSCFAPRGVDKLLDLGRLCSELDVPHICNNAYGVQCKQCMKGISSASRHGRLDAFVQSTDKNFLVPVGGAVVATSSSTHGKALLSKLSATYPGRASVAPILDLFCTLLHLGADGWSDLLAKREALASFLQGAALGRCARARRAAPRDAAQHDLYGGDAHERRRRQAHDRNGRAALGAPHLRARIVAPTTKTKEVSGIHFPNYGAHCDSYPVAYFTAACALGATEAEADLFFKKLDKTLKEWKKMKPPPPPKGVAESTTTTEENGGGSAVAGEAAAAEKEVTAAAVEEVVVAAPAPSAAAVEPSADKLEGFTIVSESIAYKRFLQVEERVISYPDGRKSSFDIVGHPKNNYVFTVIFVFHTQSQSVTLLREFARRRRRPLRVMY